MIIEGNQKVAIEWASDGELLIGQGNSVIRLSPRQASELLREIAQRDDPAIQNEIGAIEASTGAFKNAIHPDH